MPLILSDPATRRKQLSRKQTVRQMTKYFRNFKFWTAYFDLAVTNSTQKSRIKMFWMLSVSRKTRITMIFGSKSWLSYLWKRKKISFVKAKMTLLIVSQIKIWCVKLMKFWTKLKNTIRKTFAINSKRKKRKRLKTKDNKKSRKLQKNRNISLWLKRHLRRNRERSINGLLRTSQIYQIFTVCCPNKSLPRVTNSSWTNSRSVQFCIYNVKRASSWLLTRVRVRQWWHNMVLPWL